MLNSLCSMQRLKFELRCFHEIDQYGLEVNHSSAEAFQQLFEQITKRIPVYCFLSGQRNLQQN